MGCKKHEIIKEKDEYEFGQAIDIESDRSVKKGDNNREVKQVIALVNKERKKEGLPPLKEEAALMKVCHTRAYEITQLFSHTRPDGSSPFQMIPFANTAVGENIAYGQTDAAAVMRSWMSSPGHRRNILKREYTHIGVGCYSHNNQLYWVQLFVKK